MDATAAQRAICERYGVEPQPPAPGSRSGVALLGDAERWPLNGLRHPAEAGTNGWYLWPGTALRQDADFFQPLHVEHLASRLPEAVAYLALPPGWRFLLAPDHEDVWFDETLLRT